MGLPLEGFLVLDLSRVLAGPFCTMLLCADVLVENFPPGAVERFELRLPDLRLFRPEPRETWLDRCRAACIPTGPVRADGERLRREFDLPG